MFILFLFDILQAVDYEDLKDLELGINVRNKAPPYNGAGGSGTSIDFGPGGGGENGKVQPPPATEILTIFCDLRRLSIFTLGTLLFYT